MARPKKEGLEYFPLDVYAGIDDEVELIEAEYGLAGFAIFIKILQTIYRNNYYINWTEKEKLIFSKRVNVTLTLVNEVITSCLEWGLFNKRIYEKHNVLTSRGIQRRYLLAIGRRMSVEIYREYLLLDEKEVIATKNLVIVTKTPVNVDDNSQSKVKESKEKVKESKVVVENEPTAAIQYALENGFGRLVSSLELEMLITFLDDGIELDLIEKAIEEAVSNGVKNIKYIKSILNRCVESKIYTVDSYMLEQKSRKKGRNDSTTLEQPETEEMKKFLEGEDD